MNTLGALAIAIAFLRLGLIFCGIWVLVKYIKRRKYPMDYQSKCFAIATIVYLIGLMPQSLFLLCGDSSLVNSILDTGCLCWAQKFAFLSSVAFHNLLCISWMVEYIILRQKDLKTILSRCLKNKCFHSFIVAYVVIFIVGRSFFLRREDGERFFTDIASLTDEGPTPRWTSTPINQPSHVMRLQLLLCESSLAKDEVLSYLLMSYSFVILPLLLLFFVVKTRYEQVPIALPEAEVESTEGEQHYAWWEQEDNIQGILSTGITVWFHFIQPIIFSINPEHFIDFGTHLMLTICVFIPWAFPDKNYNSLQNWV